MAKAVISSTYDSKYLYFLPITTWCWNKLGVDVICFVPIEKTGSDYDKISLAMEYCNNYKLSVYQFEAPEHKEATYAQCSRLYAACLDDLPDDEILITSDIDMAVFKIPPYENTMTVLGADLVPDGQYPICFVSAKVVEWWKVMGCDGKTYQQCLDELLGGIEAEHFRGNYWGKDQETLRNRMDDYAVPVLIPRARPNTQFANHRVDRDDINWRSYVNEDLIDAHLWRDGFTEANFANIMELLKMKFPNESFDWLIDYTNEYRKLVG